MCIRDRDSTIEQIALNPGLGKPSRINLAVGLRQVPVAFGDTPARVALPAPGPKTPSFFSPPPGLSL